jgi:hypothetical protein
MAHFYADIQGNRGQATRMGTPNSGIAGHIRGWNVGCRVVCQVREDGKDEVLVYRTNGSNSGSGQLIAKFIEGEETIITKFD